MPAIMATVDAILKEIYEGPVRNQLNNDVVGLRRIERDSSGIESNVGGKYVTFPVQFGRNAGIGSRAEMADLPIAGHQATYPARIKLRYHYGAIQLSGQTLRLAATNPQAFVKALDLETDGLKNDLAISQNRQVYGDGTGAMAVLDTGATSTPVLSGIENLGINQRVEVWTRTNLNANSTPRKVGLTIVDITDNGDGTGTVDLDDGTAYTSAVANDVLVTAGSANEEWIGYQKIINSSGELYDIDPATDVPQWKATVDANSGTPRPLSEGRILANADKVRRAGGKTSLILTTLGIRASYFALLTQQRKFVNTSQDNKDFEGGFRGLAFTTDQGEIPIVTDVYAPRGTLWGISEKNVKLYREADWSFMNEDGNRWIRVPGSVAGTIKDAYAATMFQYSQMGTDRRNVHFRIDDLVEAY